MSNNRDGLDYWNSISEHRKANALKDQAAATNKIAEAQMEQAKAVRHIAEAEASAHRAAAEATRIQASIQQEKYYLEKKLKLSKTEIARFLKTAEIPIESISLKNGNALASIIHERIMYKNKRNEILSDLSYEHDSSEIHKNMDTIHRIDQGFINLDSSKELNLLASIASIYDQISITAAEISTSKSLYNNAEKKRVKILESMEGLYQDEISRETFIENLKNKSTAYKNISSKYSAFSFLITSMLCLSIFSVLSSNFSKMNNFSFEAGILFVILAITAFIFNKDINRDITNLSYKMRDFDEVRETVRLTPELLRKINNLENIEGELKDKARHEKEKAIDLTNYSEDILNQFIDSYKSFASQN